MKKVGTFIIAVALVLGLAQCKKEQPSSQVNEGETVQITLKVDGGDRHMVYPNTGAVLYTPGDVIHVGNDGRYVGSLTYEDGVFTGTLTSPHPNDHLHFYFVGGLSTDELTAGTTPSFTVDISDQSEKLPVLSYGQSTEPYSSEVSLYTSLLCNVGALVKFDLAASTANPVIVDDMLTTATINFGENPGISPTGTTGPITLYPESGTAKWAILLPQDEVENAPVIIDSEWLAVDVPEIESNGYITSGLYVYNWDFLFSVGPSTNVKFSPGNLQYSKSSGQYNFITPQYDIIKEQLSYDEEGVGENYANQDIVTLFGWGTGNNPTNTSFELTDYSEFDDWGNYVDDGSWRTLTASEWQYLVQRQGGSLYGCCMLDNGDQPIYGILLLPDNAPVIPVSFTPMVDMESGWDMETNTNIYTLEQFAQLEAVGAVFLPFHYHRSGTRITEWTLDWWMNAMWTSDIGPYDDPLLAPAFFYYEDDPAQYCVSFNPQYGFPVRLVRDAE